VILVVSLNPALDVTHHVDGVDWAGVNRPGQVRAAPGGKGLNVARTLHARGAEVMLVGLAGGIAGAAIRSGLRASGVAARLTEIEACTRRTFAVVDTRRGEVAMFNEPGPEVTSGEYSRFLAAYKEALTACTTVVLSGSLPGGLASDTYAGLIRIAASGGVPAILDTSGDALRRGRGGQPARVQPNHAARAQAVGRDGAWSSPPDRSAVLGHAAELRNRGALAVVVSMAADGLLAVTADGTWHAAAPPVDGNPTGAGDAVVAALAQGLTGGWSWPERLREAAALGSATAAAPGAGEFLDEDLARARVGVQVTDLEHALCPSFR
jgi:tagatose 6-phosphate kinase